VSESWLENTAVEEAEADGWLVRKVKYIGRDAAPDRWFLKDGRWVIIEFKDYGEPLKPQQALEAKRLKAHGAEVYAIDTIEDFRRVIQAKNS